MNKELASKINKGTILEAFSKYRYTWFEETDKTGTVIPFNMNIIGVRANIEISDQFDDILYVRYVDNKAGLIEMWIEFTTDPGAYYLLDPINKNGTAILKPGQYIDCFRSGLHKGQYKALVQNKPLPVIRCFNKDNTVNITKPNGYNRAEFKEGIDLSGNKNPFYNHTILYNGNDILYQEETTEGGFNLHRSSSTGGLKTIGKYSAGCQVVNEIDKYDVLMAAIDKAKSLHGNSFSYTLLEEKDFD